MIRIFIFGLVLVVFAGMMVNDIIKSFNHHAALKARGVAATGMMAGGVTRTKGSSKTYDLEVTYKVNGREYKKRSHVPGNVFSKYSNGMFYSAKSVPIRYLPDNPDVMEFADPDLPADHYDISWGLCLLTAGMGGYGLVCLWSCLPKKGQPVFS